MWPISNLKKKFHDWLENHALETEMAGNSHLPVWRIVP